MEQALAALRLAIRDHDWHRVSVALDAVEKASKAYPDGYTSAVIVSEPVALEGDEA